MTNGLWENLYLGSLNIQTDREIFIEKLAKEYHRRCDEYDDLICTTKNERSGGSMPANSNESVLINKNARLVMKLLLEDGLRWSVSEQELIKVIREYGRN